MTEGDWLRTINRDSHTLGGVAHQGSEVPVPLHGSLDFVLHKDSAVLAKFVVVKHSAEAQAVAQILTKAWALSTPSVILSITGGALQLSITKQLESEFVAAWPPMIRASIGSSTHCSPGTVCRKEPNGRPGKSAAVA